MHTRASLAGHPVHAMLVHFPLAFLVGAFVLDLFAVVTGGLAYDATARVLLAAGVITGVVAALPGIVDLLTSVPGGGVERRAAIIHAVLSALSLVAFGLAWALRGAARSRPTAAALALEGVGAGILLFGGRTGAALILEHHVGASPARDAEYESVERSTESVRYPTNHVLSRRAKAHARQATAPKLESSQVSKEPFGCVQKVSRQGNVL